MTYVIPSLSLIISTAFSLLWNRRVQFDLFCGHVLLECLFWSLFYFIITLKRIGLFFPCCSVLGEINSGLFSKCTHFLLLHLVFTNMLTHSLRRFGSVLPPHTFSPRFYLKFFLLLFKLPVSCSIGFCSQQSGLQVIGNSLLCSLHTVVAAPWTPPSLHS